MCVYVCEYEYAKCTGMTVHVCVCMCVVPLQVFKQLLASSTVHDIVRQVGGRG